MTKNMNSAPNLAPSEQASLKKYVLLVATMASFLTPFMGSSINLSIPAIGEQFSCSAFLLSWVVTSYVLASAAFLIPFGRLADIYGRKKIFLIGMAIFTLSSLLCGISWSISSLLFFRVVQGIGSSMIFGTSMAILTSVYPPQERGKVLGINVGAVYIGASLGPSLGGAMNHNFGWPSIFYLVTVIGIVVFWVTASKLKGEWKGAHGESFDLVGSVLYGIGLVSLMLGISSISAFVWAKYVSLFGLIVFLAFVRHEMREKQPVLDLRLFSKNKTFAYSNLAALINYSATAGYMFLISVYLQVVMGYNSQTAGLILLSQPVIMALLSPYAGTLSDRIEPRIVASWGMTMTTLGLFIFSFLSRNTPLWMFILNLIIMGIGFALFSSPNSNAVMGSVDKKFYGTASSTLGTMRLTGQTFSMAIVTLLLATLIGSVELSKAPIDIIIKSTRIAFTLFTVFCGVGVFFSRARGNVIQTSDNPR